jgi:hypothetical protein
VYIGGVLGAPPVEGITTIEILVAGCTKILWYWNFLGIGSGQYEVKGFVSLINSMMLLPFGVAAVGLLPP